MFRIFLKESANGVVFFQHGYNLWSPIDFETLMFDVLSLVLTLYFFFQFLSHPVSVFFTFTIYYLLQFFHSLLSMIQVETWIALALYKHSFHEKSWVSHWHIVGRQLQDGPSNGWQMFFIIGNTDFPRHPSWLIYTINESLLLLGYLYANKPQFTIGLY